MASVSLHEFTAYKTGLSKIKVISAYFMVLCLKETKKPEYRNCHSLPKQALGFTLCILTWMKTSPSRVGGAADCSGGNLVHCKFNFFFIVSTRPSEECFHTPVQVPGCLSNQDATDRSTFLGLFFPKPLSCVSPDFVSVTSPVWKCL